MAFSLFRKKKNTVENRYMTLRIKEVVNVAKDAVNVVFEKPETFDYEPGQFITIIDDVGGKKIRRAYSLCTTPFEDEDPAVTVKRVEGGSMSNHINDTWNLWVCSLPTILLKKIVRLYSSVEEVALPRLCLF